MENIIILDIKRNGIGYSTTITLELFKEIIKESIVGNAIFEELISKTERPKQTIELKETEIWDTGFIPE